MSSSIASSTKFLNVAIAPTLSILADLLCESDMLPGVYILLTPQEESFSS